MWEHNATMHRRNALADIFAGMSLEDIEQLQCSANDHSESEKDSSADVMKTTNTAATDTVSAPVNRETAQPISIGRTRNVRHTGIFHDRLTMCNLELSDYVSDEDTENDDEEEDEDDDERLVAFVNSPRYRQRRFGVVEHTFNENLNMLNSITSH